MKIEKTIYNKYIRNANMNRYKHKYASISEENKSKNET